MKVMIVGHPILKRSFEVLFAESNSDKFVSLDGSNLAYFIGLGWTSNPPILYRKGDAVPYRIMGKVLAEKTKLLHFHVKYSEEEKYLNYFWNIANKLIEIQQEIEEDLDLPEVVVLLANTPRRLLIRNSK